MRAALPPRALDVARPAAALRALPARVMAAPAPLRLGLSAALGAVAALGQPPASVPVLAVLALALMLALFRAGAGAWEGWAFGAGHFALALRWIVEPFLVEPEVHGWMAPFALLLMAGGLALFWAAAFALARRLRLGLLGLAALWAGAEALRSLAFTGFPWALLGHAWIGTPPMQLAPWVGPHGLTLLTLMLAVAVARAGLSAWGLGPWGALAAAWLGLDPGPPPPPDPAAPVVRIVQPNVPQAEKWDPALMPGHRARLLALSGGPGPDLVAWPETALPDLLDDARATFAAAARAARAPLASGVVRRDGARYHNALAVTDAGGAPVALYDKHHLVPFGEYLPFGDLLARWGLHGLAASEGQGFARGPGPAAVAIPGLGRAAALICYEGIFAEEVRRAAAGGSGGPGGAGRPRLLLLVTNDAWFGTGPGPRQHLALARLRAAELGLPLARAANTGISAMIDARGRVAAFVPLGQAGALDAGLPPARPPTFYARAGDGPALLVILGLLALTLARRALDRWPARP